MGNEELLRQVLDDSGQMIQVSDPDTRIMIYANAPARAFAARGDRPCAGEHCYSYMMDLDAPCPFCPLRRLEEGRSVEAEVDDGKKVFIVKTDLVDSGGRKVVVEYIRDVTEMRRADRLYRAQISALLTSIPDAQGVYHMDVTEDKCLSTAGVSREVQKSALGRSVDSLVSMISACVPDEKEQKELFDSLCRDALLRAESSGKTFLIRDTQSCADDGSVRAVRITARLFVNPVTDHLECIIYGLDTTQEVNAQKQLEKAAKDRADHIRIMETLTLNYTNAFLIDIKSGLVEVIALSDRTARTSGLEKQGTYPYMETCEKYFFRRFHPEDAAAMMANMQPERVLRELQDRDEFAGNFRTVDDGITHYYQFTYRRVRGTDYILLGILSTDALIADEVERNRRLSEARRQAESASRAKTSFLFNISHDIRTPMNASVGFTRLAEENYEDREKCLDYLKKAQSANRFLLSLLNDVLEVARIESGALSLEETACSPEVIQQELFSMFREEMESRNITFTAHRDVRAKNVLCDETKVREIYLNLLSNAVKYTPAGGEVTMELRELRELPARPGCVLLQGIVSDTGIGMSAEFLPHLFEDFSRERSSTESRVEGTGLGMAIVKKLVDLMGGTIDVKSEPGKGTVFTVTLCHRVPEAQQLSAAAEDAGAAGQDSADSTESPRAETAGATEAAKTEDAAAAEPAETAEFRGFEGKRILLAEDNDLNAEIAEAILAGFGMETERAEDGKICLDMLKGAENGHFDLILMDIQMPNMDGYSAARAIRGLADPGRSGIPIIAMTANAFTEDRRNAMDAGMNGHLAKPVEKEKLAEELRRYLL